MKESKLDRVELDPSEQEIFLIVKKVVDKVDPESILKLGCPVDEYDPESVHIAREIAAEGVSNLNRTGLANILALVFHMEFEPWSSPVVLHGIYFDIADQLLPLLGEPNVPSRS